MAINRLRKQSCTKSPVNYASYVALASHNSVPVKIFRQKEVGTLGTFRIFSDYLTSFIFATWCSLPYNKKTKTKVMRIQLAINFEFSYLKQKLYLMNTICVWLYRVNLSIGLVQIERGLHTSFLDLSHILITHDDVMLND